MKYLKYITHHHLLKELFEFNNQRIEHLKPKVEILKLMTSILKGVSPAITSTEALQSPLPAPPSSSVSFLSLVSENQKTIESLLEQTQKDIDKVRARIVSLEQKSKDFARV